MGEANIWKCPYCKKEMDISILYNEENKYNGEFIKVNRDLWHTDCYRHFCIEDSNKKIESKIKTYISKTKKSLDNNEIISSQIKSDRILLTDWILDTYNLDALTPAFYTTIDRANKGEYKEYNCKMEFSTILAIWQKMFPKLLDKWEKDCNVGNTRKGTSRVLYDFAVVVSKYEDYCDWLDNLPDEKELEKHLKDWQSMPKLPNVKNYKTQKQKTFQDLYQDVNG